MLSQTEIRNNITNRIVESLKQGRIPWRKPWTGVEGPRLPTNLTTKRPYSGINIPILWLAGQERGYEVDYWGSYKQWQSVGANVKRGERATQIVFFKPIKKTVRDEDGTERLESFPVLRVFPIFNIHQVMGDIIEPYLNRSAKPIFENADRAEFDRMVKATQADIRFGGSIAV
jgi:antirestriction protein ArdC